jgi:proteic killer suppression protein
MIESFRHKGLRLLFGSGERRFLNPQHVEKIENILGVLHAAENIKGVDVPGYRLHALSGDLKGLWSVPCVRTGESSSGLNEARRSISISSTTIE